MEIKISENGSFLSEVSMRSPWRFKRKDGTWVETTPVLVQTEYFEESDCRASVYRYVAEDESIKATRIHMEAGEHIGCFCDDIVTEESLCVFTDFSLWNGDGSVWCNVVDKHRLVARNERAGMKHFRLGLTQDDEDVLAKAGLLMPSKIAQDCSISYAMYEGLYCFGQRHHAWYGYCTSVPESIAQWHFVQEGKGLLIGPKNPEECWHLELQDARLAVYNKADPQNCMTLDLNVNGWKRYQ